VKLSGLHLLLTYQCTYECDHCFVWGSPWQSGAMTLRDVRRILDEAEQLGTIESIYLEGGEPFLYYPVLVRGVRDAAARGFAVGVVSNAYWATSVDDAHEWLRPFAGLLADLSISCDTYHGGEEDERRARDARIAAERLGIPLGVIRIAPPEEADAPAAVGQLPVAESAVRFRGRAAEKLSARAPQGPWDALDGCPYEDLREPSRVHVDPLGNVHVCQGISLGNLFRTPLREICATYDPDAHPITGPLLAGGPAELARCYAVEHGERYADACHLCVEVRGALRARFPETLGPDQMYGVEVG